MKRALLYTLVAVALGIFLCRSLKEGYVSNHVKQILNKIKMKEREGQLD